MYKLIIVDDEDEVREGMKQKTDWNACGFALAGDFCNGMEALDAVEQFRPDVVITDICMPYMDGLELAECIAGQFRDIKVVILTGYENFEYAKQAIRLKVDDYLLKPINLGEFTSFLHRLKNELDEEHARMQDLSSLRQRLHESFPLLREQFLEKLVSTRLNVQEIGRRLDYFQIELPGPRFVVLVADLDDSSKEGIAGSSYDLELRRYAVFNIFGEIGQKEYGGAVFRSRDDKVGLILSGPPDKLEVAAQRVAEQCRYAVEKYLKRTVSIGIGHACSSWEQLSCSFQEALTALEYRFLHGGNRVLTIWDVEYGKPVSYKGYNEFEKELAAAMRTGKSATVSEVLATWLTEMKHSAASPRQCYASAHKLLDVLIHVIAETGFEESELFGEDPFARIPPMNTVDELREWLDITCRNVFAFLSEKRADASKAQISSAIAYIHEHYARQDLSVGQVSQHVFLSMNYFGSLFKQHTGCTFVEYLTCYRIEKAKHLLAITALKTYDIAEKVGYGDAQYFSVIFKKITGMTPKEYRALMRGTP